MSEGIRIRLQESRPITTRQDLALVGEAYARKPSPALRRRLAKLLGQTGKLDAVIALLTQQDDLGTDELLSLASAWLTRSSPEADQEAGAAIEQALTLAAVAPERSTALTLRASIEKRCGKMDAERATLAEALELDPHNRNACMGLAALQLRAGEPEAALALADRLTTSGVDHPYVLAARTLAHARRGEIDTARALLGTDALRHAEPLGPPAGWGDIAAFNQALARELLGHPDLRYQRYGSAPTASWGIDAPLTPGAPLVRLLAERVAEAFEAHAARVAGIGHPWVAARPARATLHCSCVIAESEAHDGWHLHPTGWLNGVYYVQVPPAVAAGAGEAGCIGFGLPADLAGAEAAAAYGVEIVRPREGMLLLFPSHTYHRTFPHGLDEKRICVTFELRPS